MFRVKKLYIFMLKTFLPQFLMTFLICLFIVMMQFLWGHIDDLVGKGLGIDVVAELFFYAALSLVPLSLPLAILLASIMTFGNLGEHVELTAMKSSGISLMRVMAPLIVLVSLISAGSFYFQNNVLPMAQVKMWTLLYSFRQKSPTLDIPEGAVYTQIPGYNLYVLHKDERNNMLYNLLIYDVGSDMSSPRIVAADSGRLDFTPDQKHLVLNLYRGNWYEQMPSGGTQSMGDDLYRRESFREKEIMIPYDNNFTRMDDNEMRQQFVGKNISELRHTIDSVQLRLDSATREVARDMRSTPIVGVPTRHVVVRDGKQSFELVEPVHPAEPVRIDSLLGSLTPIERQMLVDQALSKVTNLKQDYMFKGYAVNDDSFVIRRHMIEWQKKYTLSLACLIFFFIGAPLGAIVRKGGLGTPIVLSVALFVVYYIFDNTGYKMARDGHWPVWQGMWLSSAVLLPLGVFLTKKAVNDSAVFNPDAWMNALRRITGLHQVRNLQIKEVIITEVDTDAATAALEQLRQHAEQLSTRYKSRQGFLDYWRRGYDRKAIAELSAEVESVVDMLSNARNQMVLNKAMDFPIVRNLVAYQPCRHAGLGTALACLVPLSVPAYLIGARYQATLRRELRQTATVCSQLCAILRGEYTREMEYNVS